MDDYEIQEMRKKEIIATLARIGIPLPEKQVNILTYVAGLSGGMAIAKSMKLEDVYRLQILITNYVICRQQAIQKLAYQKTVDM